MNPQAQKPAAKKPSLGSGQRFAQLKGSLQSQKSTQDAGALAAYIGQKKYGKKKMSKLSKKGKAEEKGENDKVEEKD